MKRPEIEPLDEELARLVELMQSGPAMPDEVQRRLRGRLALAVRGVTGVGADADGPLAASGSESVGGAPASELAPAADPRLGRGVLAVLRRRWGSHVLVFALGGAVGASLYATVDRGFNAAPPRSVVPSAVPSDGPADQRALDGAVAAPHVSDAPILRAPSTGGDPTPKRPPRYRRRNTVPPGLPSQPPATARPQDELLAQERALIEMARTALTRSDAQAALRLVEVHAASFPAGRLKEERESLWIQALVNARRYEQARQRARAFFAAYPQSLLRPVVQNALRAIP